MAEDHVVRGTVGDVEISFSTGKLAGQADGAVVVKVGGTEVLMTATAARSIREGVDFFPLTVDVEERMYAAGRIPGSFFRREGRATEAAILACRLIDRPLRPSFREGFRNETHIVGTVLAVDGEHAYDILALNGASAALSVSPIPFEGPIGAVRLALRDGAWHVFPTYDELHESVFELTVAGGRNADGGIDIVMVEAGATPDGLRLVAEGQAPSDEEAVARGLEEAKPYIAKLIELQLELAAKVEIPELEWPTVVDYPAELKDQVAGVASERIAEVIRIAGKHDRQDAEAVALDATLEALGLNAPEADEVARKQAKAAFRSVLKEAMRRRVVDEGVRLDGRGTSDIRPLSVEVGVIARAHGSGLFQRGETQVLNVATLGMLKMEQMLDTLDPETGKRFMHHYNFPPFSTGETGFMRGPKRREIGHGALAERAVAAVVPTSEEFPYTIRLVSEVLASNGSSSMASVCGSSLSLMDAGVPIIAPVAGIAMGLISLDGQFVSLTDILGAEDALGDMDFKVAGTADVITALQLDTKIEGLPSEVLSGALAQAKEARLAILAAMADVIAEPRAELNPTAPRIETLRIPKDKIGEVIGPKGKTIRELEAETGATIEIDEEGAFGLVRVASTDRDAQKLAIERIQMIANPPEAEVGQTYDGEVVSVMAFGAFVNILPGRDGLIHISKIDAARRVERVEDYLNLGDKVKVLVSEIDRNGKLSLLPAEPIMGPDGPSEVPDPNAPKPERRDDDRGGRDRNDRGGDRGGRNRNGGDRGGRGGGDRGGRGGGGDRGGRGGGDRGRSDGGDRGGRGRGDNDRGRSDGGNRGSDQPQRRVVSFEEDFESGL